MKRIIILIALLFATSAIAQEDFLRVPLDSTGKRLRMRSNVIGGFTVYSQGFFLDDGSGGGPLGISTNPIFTNFASGATLTANIGTTGGLALDRTTAGAPFSLRLSDGSAFYDARSIRALTSGDVVTANAGSGTFTNQQTNKTADFDTGVGTDNVTTFGIALPASGGAVVGGTTTNPIQTQSNGANIATETTLAGIKTGTDKIPSSPATDRTTAAAPFSLRLSDGSAFYDARSIRALTSGDVITANAGSGTFNNQHSNKTADFDTGAGTDNVTTFGIALPGSGGAVVGGTTTNPIQTQSNGANIATETTLAGIKTGTDKIPASPSTDRTTAAAPFSMRLSDGSAFISPATDRTTAAGPFSLRLSDGSAFYDARSIRALTSGDVVTANAGGGTFTNQQTNKTADFDTGAGTDNVTTFGIALPASGGAVVGGTTTNPIQTQSNGANIATETTLAGIKTGTDKIPASPATDRTTAAAPFSMRLSDGSAFISPATDRTTAAAPFSMRLSDGSAFIAPLLDGTFTGRIPTNGQKTGAGSIPVVPASDYVDPDVVGSTTALNALNTRASVAIAGRMGAGFTLASGTLVGTITPEVSYDGGSNWVATQFYDAATNSTSPTIAFASSNGATYRTILAGNGVTNASVRVSAFTSGTANGTMRATFSDAQLLLNTVIDGTKLTYHASATGQACAASATAPCFAVYGSSTKTLRIVSITVTATAATAALEAFQIIKFSTAPSGGTSTTLTSIAADSNDPATTATSLLKYTVAPTAGTAVGALSSFRCLAGSATVTGNCIWSATYGNGPGQRAVVLRGTAQGIGVIVTVAATVDVEIEYTEE